MSSSDKNEEDVVLQRLLQTQYACSSLSKLATRPANFVYRGILTKSFLTRDGATATTVIIKHSTDSVHTEFDPSLLDSLTSLSSTRVYAKTVVVKAPQLYLFDRETNTQVLEDFTNAGGFKSIVFSPTSASLVPQPPVIGRHLGSWLRSFHDWSSAPQQAAMRNQLWQKDPVRKLKYLVTFDVFIRVLENFPELLDGHQQTLKEVQEAMAADFQKPSNEADEGWGLIHGDFWSGNILLSNPPWNEPPQLGIIDWEFAQFGHRSYDLGQIVGDLYEKAVFLNADTKSVMEAIINGYGKLSDDMAFRTAIYVGVHLIGWYHRRPRSAPPIAQEVIVAGLTIGRDFIYKGWEKDKKFFEGTALTSLFTTK
ncbi:kinase-like domain-containing protein [Pestalotiopsis sp. NC0098]|nr:kinase-like domain-containing protein [Pestalotiopsis sp. NC0098]